MNIRGVTLTVGAAAGGMLAAAFLQTATAVADDTDFAANPFGLTPTGDADLTQGAGIPDFFESASGTQTFNFDSGDIAAGLQQLTGLDIPTGDDAVTFDDVTLPVSNLDLFGITNQGITLDQDVDLGDDLTLGEGSLFNVTDFGAGFGNVYADLAGLGDDDSDQVVDYLVTPFGDYDISDLVAPFTSDDLGNLEGLDPSAGFDFGDTIGNVIGDVGGDTGGDAGSGAADAAAEAASGFLG